MSACAPEEGTLATVLDRSLAAAFHPEQVALALAAEPTARPTVSSEILAAATHRYAISTGAETSVLFTPQAGRHKYNMQAPAAENRLGNISEPEKVPSPPFTRGTSSLRHTSASPEVVPSPPFAREARELRHSFASPAQLERVPSPPFAHAAQEPRQLLASPTERTQAKVPARPGSGGFARASLADWGRVRGAAAPRGGPPPGEVPRSSPGVSPRSVGGPALVVHSPVWSFDAAGLPTDRSMRPDAPLPDTPQVRFAQHREPVNTTPLGKGKQGNAASSTLVDAAPDEGPALARSISFVCRQVTSSLPDLCFTPAAPPEPSSAAAASSTAPSAAGMLAPAEAPASLFQGDDRNGTAIAQSGEAVSRQPSKSGLPVEVAESLQPAPAQGSSGQGFSSKLITVAAQARAAKGKAAASAPVEAATAPPVQAALAPAVRAAVTTTSMPLARVGQAAVQATEAATCAGPSTTEATCSTAAGKACMTSASAHAQIEKGASSRAGAQQPAEAQTSTECTAASPSTGAVDSGYTAAKKAFAVALATPQPAMSPSEAKDERSVKLAAEQLAPTAAAVAGTSESSAKDQPLSLSVAFSAPLPQTDLAIDWKPAAKSAAHAISNPWAAGIAASLSTSAVSGRASQGLLFPTPTPMKAVREMDAETFHTAGDEVLEEASDTATSPAEHVPSRTDKTATQEGSGKGTAAHQAAGSESAQGIDEGDSQGKSMIILLLPCQHEGVGCMCMPGSLCGC